MAAVLNVDMSDLAQVKQYEDDSVEAWFKDGARISLTACATAFTRQDHVEPDDRHYPSKAPSTAHQFTAYAVRGCRERVRQLLAFRNCFAERPFLPPSLLSKEIQVSDNLLQYSTWPSSLELATSCKLIRTSSTGNIRLLSSDGGAWAELACHGQTLTTYHLVKLPRDGGGRGGEREGVGEAVAGLSVGVQAPHQYVWTRAIHSTVSTPEAWLHPLSLLLQYRSHEGHMTGHVSTTPPVFVEEEKENGRIDAVVSLTLPHTLPLTCHNSHLHHRHPQENLRLKVLFTEGIIYCVFSDHSVPFVEALPNQNTVLRSHDPQGRFYECWQVDDVISGCVRHSLYCVDHPPSSTGLPFSMARVLGQASRLLSQVLKQSGPCARLCWKARLPLPSPPSSPLHYTVPGLGQFTVRANGHVQCVFADRTIVDFFDPRHQHTCTTSPHNSSALLTVGGTGGSSLVGNSTCPPLGGGVIKGVEVAKGVWIGEHLARVMQPNGRHVMISPDHPSSFHRYIDAVRGWCEWLAQPEDRRGQFWEGTVYDQHTQRQVLAELSKIEKFNSILSSKPPERVWLSDVEGCGLSTPPLVKEAIQRTLHLVQDIDNILGKPH